MPIALYNQFFLIKFYKHISKNTFLKKQENKKKKDRKIKIRQGERYIVRKKKKKEKESETMNPRVITRRYIVHIYIYIFEIYRISVNRDHIGEILQYIYI